MIIRFPQSLFNLLPLNLLPYKVDGHAKLNIFRVVERIYEAYLANTPLYLIKKRAKELSFIRTGNSSIEDILSALLYYGCQYVKHWKEQAGGLFLVSDFTPIIDHMTWSHVQQKLKKQPEDTSSTTLQNKNYLKPCSIAVSTMQMTSIEPPA